MVSIGRRQLRIASTAVLILLLLAHAPSAAAWSAPVHELVCELAWQQMAPATKQWLRGVRAGERQAGSFASNCAWADQVRDTEHRDSYEYHFVNVARGANGFAAARDCAAFDCVPVAVHRYLRYLVAPAAGPREAARRARALMFVAHFVADLHQPLHVGYGDDRGGNSIRVQWEGKQENLHGLFDRELPIAAGLTGVGAAPRVLASIDRTKAARWRRGDVSAWANESFTLARDRAYRSATDAKVDTAELRALTPMLVEQVQKASVRLAWLLDEAAQGRFALEPLW